jgi:hypothetical protein
VVNVCAHYPAKPKKKKELYCDCTVLPESVVTYGAGSVTIAEIRLKMSL